MEILIIIAALAAFGLIAVTIIISAEEVSRSRATALSEQTIFLEDDWEEWTYHSWLSVSPIMGKNYCWCVQA